MRFGWILAVAAGCGPGNGKVDEEGVGDTTGDLAGPSSGLVWVDATGDEVEGVGYLGDRLVYADEDGYLWPLDPRATGTDAFGLNEITHDMWDDAVLYLVYVDEDCRDAWVGAEMPLPRVVHIVPPTAFSGDIPSAGLEGVTFVAPDAADPVSVEPTWRNDASGCEDSGTPGLISVADLHKVEPPSTWWVAPLHPEF